MINEEKLKELREIYNYVKEAKKNISEKKKKMWSSWYNMMSRCYGLQSGKKGRENCLVCKGWHIPFVYYKLVFQNTIAAIWLSRFCTNFLVFSMDRDFIHLF